MIPKHGPYCSTIKDILLKELEAISLLSNEIDYLLQNPEIVSEESLETSFLPSLVIAISNIGSATSNLMTALHQMRHSLQQLLSALCHAQKSTESKSATGKSER